MSEGDAALEARVSTKVAALYLGCSVRHVEQLIRRGAVKAWDVRLPGASRARFVVARSTLRELLRSRVLRTERTESVLVAGLKNREPAE